MMIAALGEMLLVLFIVFSAAVAAGMWVGILMGWV